MNSWFFDCCSSMAGRPGYGMHLSRADSQIISAKNPLIRQVRFIPVKAKSFHGAWSSGYGLFRVTEVLLFDA